MAKTGAYLCLGCGALLMVRLKANGRIVPKPPGWLLPLTFVVEPETGIRREANLPFCSRACLAAPDTTAPWALPLHTYLGLAGPPPTAVTFQCQGPDCLHQEAWQGTGPPPPPPSPWVGFPLMAHDTQTGQSRRTYLWCCGIPCYNGIMARRFRPGRVHDEEQRLIAGLGDVGAPALARVEGPA